MESSSVADLRERLKRRAKKDTISFKTTVDILVKLNKDTNFVGFPLIFTTDGQEILTPKILEKEIIAFLKNDGRARISEIARALAVPEETVQDTAKRISSITLFLQDAILEDWFVDKSLELKGMLESAGELTFVRIAETFNLSLDLLSTKILTGLNVRFFADKTETSLIGRKHLDILSARMRGLVHALNSPKEIEWIAARIGCVQLGSAKNILKKIIRDSGISIGVFTNNESTFVPAEFTKRQGELALDSWTKRGWCELTMLRAKIGGSKSELSKWLESQNLDESSSCLVTADFALRIDKQVCEDLCVPIKETVWVDIRRILASKLGFTFILTAQDYEKISISLKRNIAELANWTVQGAAFFDLATIVGEIMDSLSKRVIKSASRLVNKPDDLLAMEMEESKLMEKVEELLVDQFGIAKDIFPAYLEILFELSITVRAALKTEIHKLLSLRERPHVTYTMDNLGDLEQSIAERYIEIIDNFDALRFFNFNSTLVELFRASGLMEGFVRSVFSHSSLRLCQSEPASVETNSDREKILNSLPNFPLVEDTKEALIFMEKLLGPEPVPNAAGLEDNLRSRLDTLSILVGAEMKKRQTVRKYISGLISELDKTQDVSLARMIGSKIVLSKMCNSRITVQLDSLNKGSLAALVTQLKVPSNISTQILTGDVSELKRMVRDFIDT